MYIGGQFDYCSTQRSVNKTKHVNMQDCTKIDFDLRLRLYQTQNTRFKAISRFGSDLKHSKQYQLHTYLHKENSSDLIICGNGQGEFFLGENNNKKQR